MDISFQNGFSMSRTTKKKTKKNLKKKTSKNDMTKRGNLKGTPFHKAEDLKKARQEIQHKVWEQVERARYFDEIIQKPEYQFIKDEFKAGLKCKYGDSQEHLVKVYSEGTGIEIDINPELAHEAVQSGAFVESLIRSAGDTFSKSVYKAKGILPNELAFDEIVDAMRKAKAL